MSCKKAALLPAQDGLHNFPTFHFIRVPMSPASRFSIFPSEVRGQYGIPGFQVLASSNPKAVNTTPTIGGWSTSLPRKYFGICDDVDFSKTWNESLGQRVIEAIATILKASCPKGVQARLRVVRMGFNRNISSNPITLFVSIVDDRQGFPSDANVLLLLQRLRDILDEHRASDSVHIDICRLSCHTTVDEGVNLCPAGHLPSFYTRRLPPYLGSSLGVKDSASTLTAYVQHTVEHLTDIFALTCCHGVTSLDEISNHGRLSPAVKVYVPALIDTEKTLDDLKQRVQAGQQKDVENLAIVQKHEAFFGEAQYTGGKRLGYRDWALIKVERVVRENEKKDLNQHVPYSPDEPGSGFTMSLGPGCDEAFRTRSRAHFERGPRLKAARRESLAIGEYFLKVPSRTTRAWVSCQLNSIQETNFDLGGTNFDLSDPNQYVESVHSFVSSGPESMVSSGGDSGSLILDLNWRPVAMIWGGQTKTDRASQNLSGASLIPMIFGDIEKTMGWVEGSLTFC